jgi:hypothetical protein
MKIAFLSEMNFEGKIPSNHPNMRTEFAWMYALDAIHHSIYNFNNIKGYDHIFIIFPKGILNLNAVGAKIANQPNPNSSLLELDIIGTLKQNNNKVHYIQEGPCWLFNEAKREHEDQIPDLNHLPRLDWINWMKTLSTFKYAVHLMPTVAAGTFSLNCAYFGIPCIGNEKVDTQLICHPELSVDIDDIEKARQLAHKLKNDLDFYKECSIFAKTSYNKNYNIINFKNKITNILL